MRRVVCILMLFLFAANIFSFSGCQKKAVKRSETPKIVATVFASFDFARQIIGSGDTVELLLPPGSESHSFEPTAQDISKIKNSDVFVYVGGENEAWVDKILSSFDEISPKIVKLLDIASPLEEEIVEGMENDETGEETASNEADNTLRQTSHIDYDEHVWTSPVNAALIVDKLSGVIAELDPTNSDIYRENTKCYLAELRQLDKNFKDVVENSPRRTLIFGDRFPFLYFVKEYGLQYFAAFAGCSTEVEASAKTVAFLIDKASSEGIPVIFHIELSNGNMARAIAAAANAKVLEFHSCHNVSKEDFVKGLTYVQAMNKNLENLAEALH